MSNRINQLQLEYLSPAPPYRDTKANIIALVGIEQGSVAYTTDTDEIGTYDGVSSWTWLGSGSGSAVWHNGTGAPGGGLGSDGDYYLDDSNGDVYTKSSGSWGTPVANIVGPTGATGSAGATGSNGADGSVIRNGSGAPSSGLGVDGDYYLDNDTGDMYQKASGSYSIVANIKGPSGDAMDALVYGNGTDGSVDFDGVNTFAFASLAGSVYTLTRNVNATSMTVSSGVSVKVVGFGIFVTGTLVIDGTIHANGNNATVNPGGSPSAGASLLPIATNKIRYSQGSNKGGSAGSPNGTGSAILGAGGRGGHGGSGGTGTAGVDAQDNALTDSSILDMSTMSALDLVRGFIHGYNGSTYTVLPWAGGGGGSCGSGGETGTGGGGSGGGHVPIFAKYVTINATGVISALGGNGADGTYSITTPRQGGGGGAGGGGGLIVLVYSSLTNNGLISVDGGTKGVNTGWRGVATLKGTANLSTSASTYNSSSTTPTSGNLVLVAVHSQKGSTPDIPTLSGTNGYNTTWTQLQTITYGATGLFRLTIFRGVTVSAVAGTISASFGVNQTGCQIQAVQFTNVDQTTNEGIVQNPSIAVGTTGSGSFSGLSSFSNVKNFVIAFLSDKSTAANVTPTTTFSELSELNVSTTGTLESQYARVEYGSTIGGSNTSGHWAMWACEIASNEVDDATDGSVGTIVEVIV